MLVFVEIFQETFLMKIQKLDFVFDRLKSLCMQIQDIHLQRYLKDIQKQEHLFD
jgi:hypothetical protein